MVTIFIPAFNEETYLEKTIQTILHAKKAVKNLPLDILIVDDASTDATPQIIDRLKKRHANIRSIRHTYNQGFGAGWKDAIRLAKYPRFIIIPGDNDASLDLLIRLFKFRNKADIIFGYYINKEGRSRLRNIFSYFYQFVYMVTFDIYLQQLNCVAIFSTEKLRRLNLKSTRFTISAEINIKLLRSGSTFAEVPGYMESDLDNFTPLKLKNMWEVALTYFALVYEVFVAKRELYNRKPVRIRLKD